MRKATLSTDMASKREVAEQELGAVVGGKPSLYHRAANGFLYGALETVGGPATCLEDGWKPRPCSPNLFPFG